MKEPMHNKGAADQLLDRSRPSLPLLLVAVKCG